MPQRRASRLRRSLDSGEAAEHFDRMVAAAGRAHGFPRPSRDAICRRHRIVRPVFADVEGPVSAIRTRDLGLAVIELGGGRRVAADRIDHRVGLSALLGKGDMRGSRKAALPAFTPQTRQASRRLRRL